MPSIRKGDDRQGLEARRLGAAETTIMKMLDNVLRCLVPVVAGWGLLCLAAGPVSARAWDSERYRGGYDLWTGDEDGDEAPAPRSSGGRLKSDRELKADVKSELTWSPFVDAHRIDVSVTNGEVTLRGTVDDLETAEAAINNAYEAGARRVISQLRIEESPEG